MKTIVCLLALAFVASVCAIPRSTNRCANEPSGTILPSLQCQFYVVCQNGQEHQVRCQPMGTFFDVNRMVCDSRPSVTCWDGVVTTTTTTTTTTEAPVTTEESTTVEPTTEAIETTAEEIVTEEATTEEVPEETTVEEIVTEESTTGEPATTAAPPNFTEMCRGVVVDILPHPTDCTQFVVCVMGRYQLEQCDEGQIFYPMVRICGVGNPDQCEA